MAELELALRCLPDSAERFLERRFDGIGREDPVRALAADIVGAAVDDEIAHRGSAGLTDTLGAFLQFRIAEAIAVLREHMI